MSEPYRPSATPPNRLNRAVHLLLAGIIAVAFVGFVVGIRQGKTIPEISPPSLEQSAAYPKAIAATAWRDFDRRLFGPNREWHSTLASLKQPPIDPPRTSAVPESERRALRTVRATRRAFPGAPPVVPHPIDQMATSSCMTCHGEGLYIGKGIRAPKMSHGFYANCTQCHVERSSPELAPSPFAESTFEPIESPTAGVRAWPGAPPTIPHPTWMRETCLSCHGPTGQAAIRTTHPTRVSCRQCHASSAVMDQVAAQDTFDRQGPLQ